MVSMGEVADFSLAAYPGTIASKGRVPRVLGASGASMVVESSRFCRRSNRRCKLLETSYVTDSGSRDSGARSHPPTTEPYTSHTLTDTPEGGWAVLPAGLADASEAGGSRQPGSLRESRQMPTVAKSTTRQ